jgi:hypothetical protein
MFTGKVKNKKKGKGVHMEPPSIASGGLQQLNAGNMNNPQFLVQMIAQQQQYIQLLLQKQRELVDQLAGYQQQAGQYTQMQQLQ